MSSIDFLGESSSSPSGSGDDFATPTINPDQTDYGLELTASQRISPRRAHLAETPKSHPRSGRFRTSVANDAPSTSSEAARRILMSTIPKKPTKFTARKSTAGVRGPRNVVGRPTLQSVAEVTAVSERPTASSTLLSRNPNQKTKQKPRKQPMPRSLARSDRKFALEMLKLCQRKIPLIPKLPFSRLVREIVNGLTDVVSSITPQGLETLQEISELYLTQTLSDAYLLSMHRGRVTLMLVDLELLKVLREGI